MSGLRYDINAPDEKIFVFKQPPRPKPRSWTDHMRQKLERFEGDSDTLTDPLYWVYLLVAFGVLALVLLGFYWILQNARAAVARKKAWANQEVIRARRGHRNSFEALPPAIGNSSNAFTNSPSNTFQIDNSGKNPEICRSGTCPSGPTALHTNQSNTYFPNSGNSNSLNVPRLTYSASTGLGPTSYGSAIHGGLGRDVCIGCKCIGCETPGNCSNGITPSIGTPYLAANSFAVQNGQGYLRDPFLA